MNPTQSGEIKKNGIANKCKHMPYKFNGNCLKDRHKIATLNPTQFDKNNNGLINKCKQISYNGDGSK